MICGRWMIVGVLVASLGACKAAPPAGPESRPQVANLAQTTRNRGYALFYGTVSDESEVDKSMIFKSVAPEVSRVLKDISHVCGQAKEQMEAFAKADASLNLKDQGLPEVEVETRKAISDATTGEVIFSGGKEFEFTILLTQHEALNYLQHIAEVLAKDDTNNARQVALKEWARQFKALHERVLTLLEQPYLHARQ